MPNHANYTKLCQIIMPNYSIKFYKIMPNRAVLFMDWINFKVVILDYFDVNYRVPRWNDQMYIRYHYCCGYDYYSWLLLFAHIIYTHTCVQYIYIDTLYIYIYIMYIHIIYIHILYIYAHHIIDMTYVVSCIIDIICIRIQIVLL